MNRKKFLLNTLGLAGATCLGSVFPSCTDSRKVSGIISGPNHALGHRLRDFIIKDEIKKHLQHDVVIVGGGVSGLSAARYLKKQDVDFVLIELENKSGGNSLYGSNATSAFPLGAHYLPLPSDHDPELKRFLEEIDVITGFDNGRPVYNEYYLCSDPKERLYIHEHWQEGLIPHSGVHAEDAQQIQRFQVLMEEFKKMKGADGKEAFCIPVDFCSNDPAITKLDELSFYEFLRQKGFTSTYLFWYVDYCCADDFGSLAKNTSAWAGIHYFASRKGDAANATADAVLTWPEGNGWLVQKLEAQVKDHIVPNSMVYSVSIKDSKATVKMLDAETETCIQIEADKVILATPQFINQRILDSSIVRKFNVAKFSYAPWMVANATVTGTQEDKRGEPLSWDNVIYGSSALGYVNANHQNLNRHSGKRVLTYYAPLLGDDISAERKTALARTYEEWYAMVIKDLKRPHPKIEEEIESLDIWIWGHGMIRPAPGFMFGADRRLAGESVGNILFFTHSDLSGISIFEEAFYRGTLGAKRALV